MPRLPHRSMGIGRVGRRDWLYPPGPTARGGVRRSAIVLALWALAGGLSSLPAAAHHSFAGFDMTKSITLHGTVKELQWTNPHCFVQLLVPGVTSQEVEWSLEMNSPLASYRGGWRPHTINPGDKLTVVVNPSKDGTPSGRLVSATDAAGHTLGNPVPSGPPKGP